MGFTRPRFDLFSLLEWIAAIAFFFALLAGAEGTATWTSDFASLPADDSALHVWLSEQGRGDVSVKRQNNSIVLEMDTTTLASLRHFASLPKPPWTQIGYQVPQGFAGSFSGRPFNGSTWLWLSGIGILVALHWYRRRYLSNAP